MHGCPGHTCGRITQPVKMSEGSNSRAGQLWLEAGKRGMDRCASLGAHAGGKRQCWDSQGSFGRAMVGEGISQVQLCIGSGLSSGCHNCGGVSMCQDVAKITLPVEDAVWVSCWCSVTVPATQCMHHSNHSSSQIMGAHSFFQTGMK